MSTKAGEALPNLSFGVKGKVKSLSWKQFEVDQDAMIQGIVDDSRLNAADSRKFEKVLKIGTKSYSKKRNCKDLWKDCEGKQVLNDIAQIVGFSDATSMVQATFVRWEREDVQIPDELVKFREYLTML